MKYRVLNLKLFFENYFRYLSRNWYIYVSKHRNIILFNFSHFMKESLFQNSFTTYNFSVLKVAILRLNRFFYCQSLFQFNIIFYTSNFFLFCVIFFILFRIFLYYSLLLFVLLFSLLTELLLSSLFRFILFFILWLLKEKYFMILKNTKRSIFR